jgi:hypothetical protein
VLYYLDDQFDQHCCVEKKTWDFCGWTSFNGMRDTIRS